MSRVQQLLAQQKQLEEDLKLAIEEERDDVLPKTKADKTSLSGLVSTVKFNR